MPSNANAALNKVPRVTLAFWVIKIVATTLGETGGDAVSMTLDLGYALATGIFFVLFLIALAAQLAVKRYNPVTYWLVILATTTVGTTISDFLDRSAHLGYMGGSAVLVAALIAVLVTWRLTLGAISFSHVADRKVEAFYWVTILVSNTLGTALGDFVSDDSGLGYHGGALIFGGLIGLIALAYAFTKAPRVLLFWAAFVLTRPLGATLGDSLTKPLAQGGLNLGTLQSSLVLALVLVLLVAFAARKPAPAEGAV
jgi:uncharacterized membrane-anchored protein